MTSTPVRSVVVLGPGEGRAYPMGRIAAVFKAEWLRDQLRVLHFGMVA